MALRGLEVRASEQKLAGWQLEAIVPIHVHPAAATFIQKPGLRSGRASELLRSYAAEHFELGRMEPLRVSQTRVKPTVVSR